MTVPVDVQSVGMSLNPTPNIPELSRWTSSGGRKQREQCIGRPHHGQGISKSCEQPLLTEMRNPHKSSISFLNDSVYHSMVLQVIVVGEIGFSDDCEANLS